MKVQLFSSKNSILSYFTFISAMFFFFACFFNSQTRGQRPYQQECRCLRVKQSIWRLQPSGTFFTRPRWTLFSSSVRFDTRRRDECLACLTEVSVAAWHRTSPWKAQAVPELQPWRRNIGGVESGKQCTSRALKLCQAWDVISFFHLLNCYSLEMSRNASLFFTPPLLCTMLFLYLWLQQQEAAEGMAETCETGWAGLKSNGLKL